MVTTKLKNSLGGKLFRLISAAGIILLIWGVLYAVVNYKLMLAITKHGQEVEIPDLFEMSFEEAERAAAKDGFEVVLQEKRYDEYYPSNIVIEQHPIPYSLSKVGRKIRVVVSEGEKLFTMPDVVGISQKEAIFKLEELGVLVPEDSINYLFSDYYPEGVVAEQSPPTGAMLNRGYPASITVSMGSLPNKFIVPDLIALNLKESTHLLRKAGLTVGEVSMIFHLQADSGVVVEQYPKPGINLEYLSPVNLKISGLPEEIENPSESIPPAAQ